MDYQAISGEYIGHNSNEQTGHNVRIRRRRRRDPTDDEA